jgi:uncharacterized protein YbjT (DUF2867 family)
MVLVVGSTGMLGSEICYRLAAKGIPIRAFVRQTSDPSRVERLKKYGAVLVQGDLRDPTSIASACEGSHGVICTATAMNSYQPGENDLQTVDLQGVTNLIRAAKQADVSHFIYVSLSGHLPLDFPLQSIKRSIEQRLIASGLQYTILRPSFFMETWLPQIPAIPGDKIRVYGQGDQPIRWVSLKDVALLAVLAFQKPAAWNATLEVGGPEALNPRQVIEILEKASGRLLEVKPIPVEALQRMLKLATDPLQQTIISLRLCYADGDSLDRHATGKVLPARLSTVSDYIAQMLVTGEHV